MRLCCSPPSIRRATSSSAAGSLASTEDANFCGPPGRAAKPASAARIAGTVPASTRSAPSRLMPRSGPNRSMSGGANWLIAKATRSAMIIHSLIAYIARAGTGPRMGPAPGFMDREASNAASEGAHAVIVADFPVPFRIRHIGRIAGIKAWCRLQSLGRNVHDIGVEIRAVFKHAPGKGEELAAEPHDTAIFEDGISNLARNLVDHEIGNMAKIIAMRIDHRRPFNRIGRNQATFFTCYAHHLLHARWSRNANTQFTEISRHSYYRYNGLRYRRRNTRKWPSRRRSDSAIARRRFS